jgi:3-oxoacyl-[acyl-carrier protein] reductase
MDLGLTGKAAIVTGGSRGIGRAIALGLADEGCAVCICARGEEALAETAAAIRARGVEALAVPADVTRPEQIVRVVDEARRALGRIDILVNNAGGSLGGGAFLDSPDAAWAAVLDTNLWAAIRFARLVIPDMQRQRGGVIITISSIYGREAGGPPSYNAAKAAEISLGKALAKELAPHGIRVVTVAPGSILFPGGAWQRRMDADPQAISEFVRREMPYGRFGAPEEVANVVVFLASERASLVTGACIPVDGGQGRSNV